ncbi:chymotrypsinogen A-like [Phlebotomus argentipes]|uniref:chymotrypsinogen A-like n=1 Tax=Phlebotomus argentipes TaxID=94469 RepID=UPI0028933F9E|nr:chymotrypsinogen A-like [Phlebotomus argentipes]
MKILYFFILATSLLVVLSGSLTETLSAEPNSQTRIIGGQPAVDTQFPYQVRLTVYGFLVSSFLLIGWCGGAIINEEWTLTAAHCITRDPNPLPYVVVYVYVEAGSVIANQARQKTSVPIQNIFVHPDYDSSTRDSDIALLKTKPFDLGTAYVKAIKLPSYSTDRDKYAGWTATVAGFGVTVNSMTASPSNRMNFIQLTVITRAACEAEYSTVIETKAICAEDLTPPKSTICNYDSGGALAVVESGETTVIGTVSFIYAGECDGSAQSFAYIPELVNWITGIMNSN